MLVPVPTAVKEPKVKPVAVGTGVGSVKPVDNEPVRLSLSDIDKPKNVQDSFANQIEAEIAEGSKKYSYVQSRSRKVSRFHEGPRCQVGGQSGTGMRTRGSRL